MKKYFLPLVTVLSLTLTGIFFNKVKTSIYWLEVVGDVLHTEMGFSHGSPYINGEEIFIVDKVVPYGAMALSGMKPGDVPYGIGMDNFYSMLWKCRGTSLRVDVVSIYDRPALSVKRTLLINVPRMKQVNQ